ncbi:MAG: arginine deiminase-related protein [Dehalococcoidia bacterium]
MTASTHILMCEPEHYRIEYEINPWMNRANAVVTDRARQQWTNLHRTLHDLGVRIALAQQGAHVPDMVFTANAGIVVGRRFIPSKFRFEQRQREIPLLTEWFSNRGYEVVELPRGHTWEGEGDVLESEGRVFAASGNRTDAAALDALDEVLGLPVVRLSLKDPRFYHLDTCFFPVDAHCAMYVPDAFDAVSRSRLEATFDDLIEVPIEDALRFACNALRVGETVVLNTGCDQVVEALGRRGYRCVATPTSEFIKAGGSVKCLTLTLDRFVAAG